MDKQIYLDSAATTKPSNEVVKLLSETMQSMYANPDSMHAMGLGTLKQVEHSRGIIAASLNVKSEEVIFTSSGTEANNLALFGAAKAQKRKGNKIIVTNAEHPSVHLPALELEKNGFEVIFLSTKNGKIDMDEFKSRLDSRVILISAMLVNNETGSVFDIASIAKIVENSGFLPYIHCDAVQAFGKIPIDLAKLKVDMMSLSSHKIHGIKGCGALFLRKGTKITPQIFGGGQENGLRSSTLNTPGIFAFGKAAEEIFRDFDQNNKYIESLYDHAVLKITEKCPDIVFNQVNQYSKYILSLRLPDIKSEVMLNYLSAKKIYVSSGSACSEKRQNSKESKRVLLNYGLDKKSADFTIRASFSKYNTIDEIEEFADALAEGIERFKTFAIA
jgi:cysteine desulfurase